MKKYLLIFAAIIFTTSVALADFNNSSDHTGTEGFQSSAEAAHSITPVKNILNMRNDEIVTVQGNIIKRISEDKYLFKDKTGEIVIEIEHKYWSGIQVSEKDTLELTGKIDKDYNSIVLDVFNVKKTK